MGSSQPVTIKFDPQSYLLSYYNDSNNTMRNDILSTQRDSYKYVKLLDSTIITPFPQCVSVLNGNSNTNNLIAKPIRKKIEQYFRPKITLYRVSYDAGGNPIQRRFFFDGTQNAAIKSCEITLAGSNPVTAEKQIEFKIVFSFYGLSAFCGNASKTEPFYTSTNLNQTDAFQNIYEAWTKSNDVEDQVFAENGVNWKTETGEPITKNYWSLIFHPSVNNTTNNQAGGRTTYNTENFRIKAVIGRHITEDAITQLTNSIMNNDGLGIYGKTSADKIRFIENLKEFITFDSKSYFLNLVKHEFKLEPTVSNKGNVNIELTAEYIAEFESTTHNYDYNILGDLSEQLDSIKNETIGVLRQKQVEAGNEPDSQLDLTAKLNNQLGIDLQTAGEIASNISDNFTIKDFENYNKITKLVLNSGGDEETTKCLTALGITDPTVINNYIKLSKSEEQKSKLLATIDELNNQVNQLVSAETIRIKNKYYSKFINTLLSEDGKYYSVTVTPEDKKAWQDWANNKGGAKPLWPKATLGTLNPTNKDQFLKEIEKAQENSKSNEQTSDELEELRKQYSTAILEKSDPTNIDIVFVTFGHFIDCAYKTIELLLAGDGFSYKSFTDGERKKRINTLEKHKTILSNLSGEYSVFNINNGTNVEGVNLASLPIDLNLIKVFLIDFIVKPQKSTYSLYAFLKDATSVLAINSLNMNTVYNSEVNNSADASLASSIITLGVVNSEEPDPLDKFGGAKINANQLTFDSLISNYVNPSIKHSNFYNYYLMYDKNLKDFGGTGNIVDDFKKGIIHLNPNQSDSFTKKVTFKRMDQPYLKESKAVGQKTFFLGQFRDFYNATLDIVGTNYFFPGMIVYTIPFTEAPKQFSNITGIGGYYTVIKTISTIVPQDSSWDTKLETIWHSSTDADGLPKAQSNSECEQTINEILGDNKRTDLFANTLNSLSNNLFGQIEQAEQAEADVRAREAERAEREMLLK